MRDKKKNRTSIVFAVVLGVVAYAISILCVITGAYVQEGYNLSVNEVSQKRFQAYREVENKVATDLLRADAANGVVPLYMHDPQINERIRAKMESFFDEVSSMRMNYIPIYNPMAQTEEQEDNTLDETEVLDKSSLSIPLSDEQVRHIVTCDSAEFNRLYQSVGSIIEETLTAGIKTETVQKTLLSIKEDFDALDWDASWKTLGIDIAGALIEPNLVVNEESTQKLRDERAAAVEPVFYRKGQNIVNAGEVITEEAYYALQELGYIDTGYAEKIAPIVGSVIFVTLIFVIAAMYMQFYYKDLLHNRKQTVLLFTLYLMTVVLTRVMTSLPFYFMPILVFAMLVGVLIHSRLSIVLTMCVTVICLVIWNGDLQFICYFVINGIFAAITAKYVGERTKIFTVSVAFAAVNALTVTASYLLFDKGFSNEMMNSLIYAVLSGLLTVILCIGAQPFWESVFGIVTPARLLDLTNPNNELLRRLTIEAPGTYHHSLIVANLAETASYDIGANHVLARVGAYYHDIGKLKYPQYFAENQAGSNPHDSMEPKESVEVITSHVSSGLELAAQNKLPSQICEIIEQHHGTTMMKFFYFKQKNLNPDGEIDDMDFRYKHRIPQSREAAVVMLADTVEAAVRSTVPSGKTMTEVEVFVRTLIKDKLDDGQLEDSGLAIKDLDIAARAFMRVFKGMYHERIPYPKGTTKELSAAKEEAASGEEKMEGIKS